jgi:DNA-binding response OmpR family regulator
MRILLMEDDQIAAEAVSSGLSEIGHSVGQARVEALGRRPSGMAAPTTLLIDRDLELDRLRRAGRQIELQFREFELLECLMLHAGQIVTRNMLLESVWDLQFDPRTNVVESHVSRLRSKVDKGSSKDRFIRFEASVMYPCSG